MKKENQISPKIISLSFAVIVLLAVTAFYIFAWTEPSVAPPNGNVAVPLNTGADGQYKIGRLQIGNSATGWISDSISGFSEPVVSNDGFIFVGGYTGAEDSDLRLYMVDNSAERFSIWSDTCGGGNCGDLNAATLKHYFTGGGDAWHSSKMTATQICIEGKSCISDWSDVTGTSYWTASGNNIYNNNSGNVGIGTTNPLSGLHVRGAGGSGDVRFERTDQGPSFVAVSSAIGTNGKEIGQFVFLAKNTSDSTLEFGRIGMWQKGASAEDGYLYFKTGSLGSVATRMVIDSSGNVGIGTTVPGYKLDIQGTTAQMQIKSTTGTNYALFKMNNTGGDLYFGREQSTGGGLAAGSTGYAGIINAQGIYPLQLAINNAIGITMLNGGNVGIGTIAPGEKLSVNGILDMMNHKIKNVSEIDPVFGIQGKKYVSYMPDSIGQKIEVVGESQLAGNGLEIDLAKEQEGSDLWLFWQTASRESIIPFVSPQDNASLYAYIDGSKLVVKLAQGQENAKFSYRLIATRLDHAGEGSNLYSDQSVQHFIDIDSLRK